MYIIILYQTYNHLLKLWNIFLSLKALANDTVLLMQSKHGLQKLNSFFAALEMPKKSFLFSKFDILKRHTLLLDVNVTVKISHKYFFEISLELLKKGHRERLTLYLTK